MQRLRFAVLALIAGSVAPLPAQTVDVLGSTANPVTEPNRAKANLFAVDTTTLVLELEMWLDVPTASTLTFFAYRHHSRSGDGTLEWTQPVQAAGGGGPQWHSTGPIALALVGGNHYAIGVSWSNSLTYYFSIATPGQAVSFGNWQRAHTVFSSQLPPTLTFTGSDIAQYFQRLTSVPLPAVVVTGTGCSATPTVPRLVADRLFAINTTPRLELVDAEPGAIGVFGLAVGGALASPLPLFNCSIWLDASGPIVALASPTSGAGYASLQFPVPNDPALAGQTFSAQGLVLGLAGVDVTNAVSFTVN
jgi:hypothetical protein